MITTALKLATSKPDDSVNHIESVIHMADSRDAERSFRLILNDMAKGLLTGKMAREASKNARPTFSRIAAITLKPAAILSAQPQPRTLCRFHNVAIMIATY